jgi:hypothetical protein
MKSSITSSIEMDTQRHKDYVFFETPVKTGGHRDGDFIEWIPACAGISGYLRAFVVLWWYLGIGLMSAHTCEL